MNLKLFSKCIIVICTGYGINAHAPLCAQSRNVAEMSWKKWISSLENELSSWEKSEYKEHRHSFFWSNGSKWEIWWKTINQSQERQDILTAEQIIATANRFIHSNFPDSIRSGITITGCQKLNLAVGKSVWFVDLSIDPIYYISTGVPTRAFISIPINSDGNILCEIRKVE